jgi:phosphoenolpyruvate carboxykinase (GTP)
MLPFCGYNMGDYFNHWLQFTKHTDPAKLPRVYFVNWFRKDASGRWLWPGYGENSRVLKWICERVEGRASSQQTAIGNLPTPDVLDTSGLNVTRQDMTLLTSVDAAGWKKEADDIASYYIKFDGHLPRALASQLDQLRKRLE